MRRAGQDSWQISMGTSLSVNVALYVRDAAGLEPEAEPQLPPLVPTVPRIDTSTMDNLDLATRDWARWWAELLVEPSACWIGPPDHGLSDDSQLLPIVAACWHAAARWPGVDRRLSLATDRRVARLPNRVVNEVERELGRPAQPFRLHVYVVPVGGTESWQLTPNRLLASEDAMRDPETLRPLVRSLA